MRTLSLLAAALIGLASFAATAANAQTKLKFVLNWKYQGPQGWFFLADDRGYFKAEGLDVTIDQGNGSGAAVPLVANGCAEANCVVPEHPVAASSEMAASGGK